MTKPAGILFSASFAFMVTALALPVLCDAPAKAAKATATAATMATKGTATGSPGTAAATGTVAAVNPAPQARSPKAPIDPKVRFKPPAPLKRLVFSARQGFSLRMVSSQDVTAEIRNGAGRTLAHGSYTLEAGDWTLRPRNLAPGLYTVLLRTGPQLRSLRMKIEDSERGEGSPEWILEKAADSSAVREPSPAIQGAVLIPGD
jgi:hypothetical protein